MLLNLKNEFILFLFLNVYSILHNNLFFIFYYFQLFNFFNNIILTFLLIIHLYLINSNHSLFLL